MRVLPRLAVVVALVVGLCATSDAPAANVRGPKWPGGLIRYFNAAHDQAWAVKQAVAAWNTSGAHIRFVAVPRQKADLVIEHFPGARCASLGDKRAEATIGFVRGHGARIWLYSRDETTFECNHYVTATYVAHELGHVLGLGHEDRGCAAMNSRASLWGPSKCPRRSFLEWHCRLLTDDDIHGAIRLYGGKNTRTRRGASTCLFYDPIATPSHFTAAYRPDQVGVELSFERPTTPRLQPFMKRLLDQVEPNAHREGYAFISRRDTCPTTRDYPAARRLNWGSVAVGAAIHIYDRLPPPGRYCYAVWALDAVGWPSRAAATAWVDVP